MQCLLLLICSVLNFNLGKIVPSTSSVTVEVYSSFPIAQPDSVQAFLYRLSLMDSSLVSLIPETERWHLNTPRPDAVPDSLLPLLHEAFFHDMEKICKFYGDKYLADWKALLSKAARESFWGTSYLCNRANNYFGIRRRNKDWVCESFDYCFTIDRDDPAPEEFVMFPSFEASLWTFIHTIYSSHYLQRLPDKGVRIQQAILFERNYGIHYWWEAEDGSTFSKALPGEPYAPGELLYTWSGYEHWNLCIECSYESDLEWVWKVVKADWRIKKSKAE